MRTGWIPPQQTPEFFKLKKSHTLPKSRMISITPEVFDQGHLGSCTSNAVILAYAHSKKKVQLCTQDFSCITTQGLIKK